MRLKFQENTYFSGLRNSSGMAESESLNWLQIIAGNVFGFMCMMVSFDAETYPANSAKHIHGRNCKRTNDLAARNGETRKLSCNKEIFIKNILVFRTHRCAGILFALDRCAWHM